MLAISRNHNFENGLNLVQRGNKYFYLWHEKSVNPVKVKITENGINAFISEEWDFFLQQEARFFGGNCA